MSKIELPALPEPELLGTEVVGHVAEFYGHTASQLRARDRQIVELCAQAVLDAGPQKGPIRLVSEAFAAAIRALLGDKGEK